MATKKGKTKGAKRPKAAAKKRSSAARPKKAVARRKRAAPRKPTARKASARSKAPKKSVPKKSRASSPGPKAKTLKTVRREDRPGHLDPHYAAELRRQSIPQERDPAPFFATPRSRDDLAEELGEEVVERATTGEDEAEDTLDPIVPEEQGGPFVETNAGQEFASGTDASNPKGAKREPFPTT